MTSFTDHAEQNRRDWDARSTAYQAAHGGQLASGDEPAWGVWQIPDSRVGVFTDVAGKDVLEIGCGGGQTLVRLGRRGARQVGLDVSERQLEHARALIDAAGVEAELVHGSAEDLPFPDRSFDLVHCDHGAMSFAEPRLTVPEAARVLRPGGMLAFNVPSDWIGACYDPEEKRVVERLVRGYWDRYRIEDEGSVEFRITAGDWVRLFRANGLRIEDLVELRPDEDDTTTYDWWVPLDWARRWPAEYVWRTTREGL